MKLDFARNTKRNFAAAAVNKVVGLLFPFLNRTLFLWLMGPGYLGLNGLFTSILGVLMLADLGFGTAVVCSMYKPIAEDDRNLVCAYLRFYRTVYRWVGGFIFFGGLCLLPFLRCLVHGELPPDVDLHVLYLIHLVNTSVSYFLFAYRGSVLNAYHRNDVLTNIHTATSVAQYLTVFLVLFLTRNYYYYVATTVFFTVVVNILTVLEARRLFPEIEPRGTLPPALRRQVVSDVKSIFMHKVGAVISHSVDNIVISAFLGLVAVAAFGNYYYVVTAVTGLVWAVYNSMNAGFGNKVYTESKAENFELFMKANRLTLAVVAFCAAVMLALYQPFVRIWTGNSPELVRHALTPLLMVLYFCINQSRQPLLTFKAAASLWRADRWKPIVAGAANLTMNISFVLFLPDAYKLDGVILSTVLSYVFIQMPWESHVVFTRFFDGEQGRRYWRTQAKFALATVAICAAAWGAVQAVPLGGKVGLLLDAAVAAAVSSALLLVLFRGEARIVADRLFSMGKAASPGTRAEGLQEP